MGFIVPIVGYDVCDLAFNLNVFVYILQERYFDAYSSCGTNVLVVAVFYFGSGCRR